MVGAIEEYLKLCSYKDISECHQQMFRNYDFDGIMKYGKTETEQVYNRLKETGWLELNGVEK